MPISILYACIKYSNRKLGTGSDASGKLPDRQAVRQQAGWAHIRPQRVTEATSSSTESRLEPELHR